MTAGMPRGDMVCWELLSAEGTGLEQARRLYEATQAADERVPWKWIASAVTERAAWRPGRWSPHLIVAAPRGARKAAAEPVGFAYGAHVPGLGGYLAYIGVDPAARAGGVGTRLVEVMVRLCQADAACEGGELPFVVWESRPPAPGDGGSAREAWRARLGLWRRAGARWVSGLTFHAVNYNRRKAPPVPLALFVRPAGRPVESFDAAALRELAAALLREVYGRGPGDENYERTLPEGCRPELRPVDEAAGLAVGGG